MCCSTSWMVGKYMMANPLLQAKVLLWLNGLNRRCLLCYQIYLTCRWIQVKFPTGKIGSKAMATMGSNPRSTPSPKSFPMSVNCISWLEIQTVAYSFQVLFKNIPSQMILHLKLLIDPRSVLTTGHPKLVWMALVLFSVISDKREVTRITQG